MKNLTTNEQVNFRRYEYLKNSMGQFSNPFDRGAKENLKEFFHLKRSVEEVTTQNPAMSVWVSNTKKTWRKVPEKPTSIQFNYSLESFHRFFFKAKSVQMQVRPRISIRGQRNIKVFIFCIKISQKPFCSFYLSFWLHSIY